MKTSKEPTVDEVLSAHVAWKEVHPGGVEFVAQVRGYSCNLRMNDFPDERLYTLTVSGESMDLDDAPPGWEFPGKQA
jgi:hypothetical protein